jgi:RNA recognition motif-containing protein
VFLLYNPEGGGFVSCSNAAAEAAALLRTKATLGKRYIEVLRANPAEAQAAVAKRLELNQSDADAATVVRVRGLPWQATTQGVVRFFEGSGAKVAGVHLVVRQARPSGEALVEFESDADAAAALAKDRHTFEGGRWLEVMPAAKGELYVYQQQQQQPPPGPAAAASAVAGSAATGGVQWVDPLESMGGCGEGGPRVVKVKGVPVAATKPEIVAHFYGELCKHPTKKMSRENLRAPG